MFDLEARFWSRVQTDPCICFIGVQNQSQYVSPEQRDAEAAAQAAQAQQDQTVINGGTTYETTLGAYNSGANRFHPLDPRNYQYGRSAIGADQAVGQALLTGANATNVGSNILSQDTGLAADARARTAPTGDFGQQNTALGQSLNYGQQLSGLESQQGPSAAQAQLASGTNQALASQIALARSGRGFGGNAAAMGQAQGNLAGIQANQANSAAMLRAQEDAAFRQRQATNLGTAAGIAQGAGTQFGTQAGTNLNAYLTNQAQADQASLGYLGQGATAYGQGVAQNFAGQGLANNIRGQELSAGEAADDRALRAWAAERGFQLQQNAADAQQTAALIQGGATLAGGIIGTFGGPAGTAGGATGGAALGKALTA